jgi:hypothetical protein
MAEIIARFADGRLLVQEDKLCESRYCGSGVPVRIGHLRVIEKVLSLTTNYEKYGLITPLQEAWVGYAISGGPWSGQPQERADTLMVVMRRGDVEGMGVVSGLLVVSGGAAKGLMSGITSGLSYMGELASGLIAISGAVKVQANVIGY